MEMAYLQKKKKRIVVDLLLEKQISDS